MTETRKEKMKLTLLSDLEILTERTFNAPRALVFEVYTTTEHVRRFWGSQDSPMTVCEIDLRPGGTWRFVTRGADGNEDGFRGEYREIVPPERLVYTFEYEGMPGHISVESAEFIEAEGKTTLRAVTTFASREDRDGMLQSGMEEGANDLYDRLDEALASLKR